MKYDISKLTAPKMPNLGKGTDCIKILLSQVSKDMHEPLVPMLFPVLGAHVNGSEFQYPDLTWKELCGQMANLVAESGGNKGQFSLLVEAICRDFRQHDDEELKKLMEWQKQVKKMGANKEKPVRPEIAFWFPPSDVTNPAFLQNAMACENLGERTQYFNMPEVEMADRMCGGHKQVTQMLRNIYDCQRAGALRATADGVTGNPILRAVPLPIKDLGVGISFFFTAEQTTTALLFFLLGSGLKHSRVGLVTSFQCSGSSVNFGTDFCFVAPGTLRGHISVGTDLYC